jgi:hypothetical protein
VPRAVLCRHERPKIRVVGILVPFVVITKIRARVVGRVGKHEIDLTTVFVKRNHGVEVVSLHNQVARLIFLQAERELLLDLLAARLDAADNPPWRCLPLIVETQASSFVGVTLSEQRD